MSPSSRVRKPRRSHAELMKLPWRRMKVRKLENERKSGAARVFGEALRLGLHIFLGPCKVHLGPCMCIGGPFPLYPPNHCSCCGSLG